LSERAGLSTVDGPSVSDKVSTEFHRIAVGPGVKGIESVTDLKECVREANRDEKQVAIWGLSVWKTL